MRCLSKQGKILTSAGMSNFNFLFLQSRYRRWLKCAAEPRLDARGGRIGCRNH